MSNNIVKKIYNQSISLLFFNIVHFITYKDINFDNNLFTDIDNIVITDYDTITMNIFIKFYEQIFKLYNFNLNSLIDNIKSFYNINNFNNINYDQFIILYNDYLDNYPKVYINNINNSIDYFQPNFLYKYYKHKKYYKYYNFILYYLHKILFILAYIIFNLLFFITRFYQFYHLPNLLDEFEVYVGVAKGSARLIYINIVLIFIPSLVNNIFKIANLINYKMLDKTNSTYYNRIVNNIKLFIIYMPYYFDFHFHYLCGSVIFICSIIHAISHIFSFYTISSINNCCIWNNLNLDKLNLNENMNHSIIYYLSIISIWTGILLIIIIFINIYIIYLYFKNKIRHSTFYIIHTYSFLLWFVIFYLHGRDNWLRKTKILHWVLPILIIFMFNKRDKFFYLHKIKCIKSDIYKNKFIRLTFFKNEKLKKWFDNSNMDIGINFPQISKLEWHTFSIVTSPEDDYIILYIKILGKWTNNLHSYLIQNNYVNHDYINLNENNQLYMYINGPYNNVLQYYKLYKVITFITNGVGINTFISFLRDYIYKMYNNDDKYKHIDMINIIWIINDHTDFQIFQKTLNSINQYKLNDKIKLYVFFTYNISPFSKNCLQFLQYHIYKINKYDIVSGLYLDNLTVINKPNFKNVFQNLILLNKDYDKIGIFFCGNFNLKKKILRKCYKYSNNTYNLKFHFYNVD